MRTAVCVIVKNEERDFAEWLAYQFAIGFDAVFVYDNGSTDRTADIAWRFLNRHFGVSLIDWRTTALDAQVTAYDHCLGTQGQNFDWIAFFDSDELLVPHAGSVQALLKRHAKSDAVVVNWASFGSSGHDTRPPGSLIETFCRRAPSESVRNQCVKYIVRPSKVTRAHSPCIFEVKGDIRTPAGRRPAWKHELVSTRTIEHTTAQLNHYVTRSRAEWDRKMARGWLDFPGRAAKTAPLFPQFDRNDIIDISAHRFLPKVRSNLAWIAADRPAVAEGAR